VAAGLGAGRAALVRKRVERMTASASGGGRGRGPSSSALGGNQSAVRSRSAFSASLKAARQAKLAKNALSAGGAGVSTGAVDLAKSEDGRAWALDL
jgi:hypothetical protein